MCPVGTPSAVGYIGAAESVWMAFDKIFNSKWLDLSQVCALELQERQTWSGGGWWALLRSWTRGIFAGQGVWAGAKIPSPA